MPMREAGRWLSLAAVLYAVAAQAHIVYGTKTLHGLVAEAEIVLHARILTVGVPLGVTTERGSGSRPTVEAEVLGVLKGDFVGERVRFAQHGHGVAAFAPGDETLLFLLDIERSRELGTLARSGALDWVSLQEHEDVYPVRADTRAVLLEAVRGYVAEATASQAARQASLRRATVGLLTSGDADLAASALRDLVLAPKAPLVTAEDLPLLLPLVGDPDTSMGVRAALLAELDRRQLVDGDPLWLRLLSSEAPPRDRITAIRAAGASAGPSVGPRLVALLADENADVAAAAAAALGRPRDATSVAHLAQALSHDAAKVRMAAIRSLGRVATPAADRALATAAASHSDPATRRRARSELAKRAQAGRD